MTWSTICGEANPFQRSSALSAGNGEKSVRRRSAAAAGRHLPTSGRSGTDFLGAARLIEAKKLGFEPLVTMFYGQDGLLSILKTWFLNFFDKRLARISPQRIQLDLEKS